MNLLRSDLRRIRGRRAVIGVMIGVFGLLVLIDSLQYAKAHPRRTTFQQTMVLKEPPPKQCVFESAPRIKVDQQCLFEHVDNLDFQFGAPGEPNPPGIEVETYNTENGSSYFRGGMRARIGGWGIGLSLAALVIGSTFIGADFGTSFVGQMVFEPRRTTVFVSKALGAAIASVVFALAIIAVDALLFWLTASNRGTVGTIDGSWVVARLGDLARVSACITAAAITGVGFTMIMRRTAASLGVYFGSAIALQFITASETLRPFAKFIPLNSLIFVALLPKVFQGDHSRYGSTAVAAIFLVVWTSGAAIVGLTTFQRREVR